MKECKKCRHIPSWQSNEGWQDRQPYGTCGRKQKCTESYGEKA